METFLRINRKAICWYQYTTTRNFYDVLNLSRNCTHREIRDAFAKLSKQYHPDTCKSGNVQQNTRKFQEIVEAYKVLGKKDSRASYDASSYTRGRSPYDGSQYDGSHYQYPEYERMRRRTYHNQYHQYYDSNRHQNYDWSSYRVYRPYERPGQQYSSSDVPFHGFKMTNRQFLWFIWAFIIFNSLAQVTLAKRRIHAEHSIKTQEIPKYNLQHLHGRPVYSQVSKTDAE